MKKFNRALLLLVALLTVFGVSEVICQQTVELVYASSEYTIFIGSGDVTSCAANSDSVYYRGNITLKPGFHTTPGIKTLVGPNIKLPAIPHTIEYAYDNLGNVIEEKIDDGKFVSSYIYDTQARLEKVFTKTELETVNKLEAKYDYNIADQIKQIDYPGGEVVKYQYKPDRGWLNNIQSNAGDESIRFIEELEYNTNGNIQQQKITNVQINPAQLTITYLYDDMNRLLSATGGGFDEYYSYYPDGGFISKSRSEQNIVYAYEPGNHRLANVTLNGGSPSSFSYDTKGNIIIDGFNRANILQYDHRNLPLKISKNGVTTGYQYNDQGDRINKKNEDGEEHYINDPGGKTLLVYDLNNYKISMANIYGNGLIGKIEHTEEVAPERYYYVKDHLGSIRLTLFNNTGGFEAASARDYYPYGEVIEGRDYVIGSQIDKYKFTEKERDEETGYDYFGARYYDSRIARWLQVDPLAEKYPGWSPYNYVMDNPLKYTDPHGDSVKVDERLWELPTGKPEDKYADARKNDFYGWWYSPNESNPEITNGDVLMQQFGPDGPLESVSLNFELGLPDNSSGRNYSNAVTGFGLHGQSLDNLNLGREGIFDVTEDYKNIDNLKIGIFFNDQGGDARSNLGTTKHELEAHALQLINQLKNSNIGDKIMIGSRQHELTTVKLRYTK